METALIPRRLLFGNPDRADAQISPNGTQLSFLAPHNGVLNVWVAPVDDPGAARPVTNDTARGIRDHLWAHTNQHILYLQDQAGDENWRVFCVDLESDQTLDLTPFEGVQARVQEVSHKFPDEILIALNQRNEQLHDLFRVNIRTGQREMLVENPGFVAFETDDFELRLGQAMTPDGGCQFVRPAADGQWAACIAVGPDDALSTGPVGFDADQKSVYLVDSRERNTAAITRLNLDTGETTLLAEDARADASEVIWEVRSKTLQAVAFNFERRHWIVLDESIRADVEHLETVADGDFSIAARTLDDRKWIITYEIDDGPRRVYLYDRDAKAATFLFTNRSALENAPLAKLQPVTIKSRDGYDLVSYLTLPAEHLDADARPRRPLPMVLLVHGGPWHRDEWGYQPEHQWLANRGYAVLSVNFRGSTGFGKAFINAANQEWGGRMHDDLLDAVEWAIREKLADPRRIGIMGGSYGGYAVLWALTNSPEVFACGVDIVGPSNLITLIESIPPYWAPMLDLFTSRVGDHRTEEGKQLLAQRSPLTYVKQIQRPLLIGQGANDPRVKQAESDQIVAAMNAKGIPVTYVLYSDEGHGFARPENSLSFNALAEQFLATHLGGRCEPIGDDFAGSTITVPHGAAQVPGVVDQLPEGACGTG